MNPRLFWRLYGGKITGGIIIVSVIIGMCAYGGILTIHNRKPRYLKYVCIIKGTPILCPHCLKTLMHANETYVWRGDIKDFAMLTTDRNRGCFECIYCKGNLDTFIVKELQYNDLMYDNMEVAHRVGKGVPEPWYTYNY